MNIDKNLNSLKNYTILDTDNSEIVYFVGTQFFGAYKSDTVVTDLILFLTVRPTPLHKILETAAIL